MCWYDDDGGWTPLSDGVRIARKEHRCAAGCRIRPGDTHHYWTGLWEGDFYTDRACAPCVAAAEALGAACRIYERESTNPLYHELLSAYREHLDEGELPPGVVPPEVRRRLRLHYAGLRQRLGVTA